jgi:sulfate transport system ATP-binding protein
VVVFNHGRIEQIGSPEEVYEQPASPFVIDFLGRANRFGAEGEASYARPHEIEVSATPFDNGQSATVEHYTRHGPLVQLALSAEDGKVVEVDVFREQADSLKLARGQRLYYRPRHLRVFPTTEAAQPELII